MLVGYILSWVCLRWCVVLSVTFIFFFANYGVVCIELANLSLGDLEAISITRLIIIIKSEVSTIAVVAIFFCGCVSEMVVPSFAAHPCHTHTHHTPTHTLPHYHHYANLSEGIELLKCLTDVSCLECVSKIRSVLSIIPHAIYVAVCIQRTHFSYDDCENICIWSYYHHQIGSKYDPFVIFRVRSWNNGMYSMSFYILLTRISLSLLLVIIFAMVSSSIRLCKNQWSNTDGQG